MREIDRYLRDHDGVVTLGQARLSGLDKHAVSRLVLSGRWMQCERGVYRAVDRPFTDEARVRVAVWGYGDDAVASGLAAAWWLGLTRYAPKVVEVTIPRESRRVPRFGTRLRRRDLQPVDVVERRGLRTTALDLTVVEAASRQGGGSPIVDQALQRHATEVRQLWRAHLRNKGRHGAPRSRRLLQTAEAGGRSAAERLLVRIMRAARVAGWRSNQTIAGYEVDFVFADAKVVVEVDGFAYHSRPEDFEHDRRKQNAIALAGYQVLRFTWLDLTEYPERVVTEIRRAICGT